MHNYVRATLRKLEMVPNGDDTKYFPINSNASGAISLDGVLYQKSSVSTLKVRVRCFNYYSIVWALFLLQICTSIVLMHASRSAHEQS